MAASGGIVAVRSPYSRPRGTAKSAFGCDTGDTKQLLVAARSVDNKGSTLSTVANRKKNVPTFLPERKSEKKINRARDYSLVRRNKDILTH